MFCVRLDRPSRLGVAAVKSAQEVAGFFTRTSMFGLGGNCLDILHPLPVRLPGVGSVRARKKVDVGFARVGLTLPRTGGSP